MTEDDDQLPIVDWSLPPSAYPRPAPLPPPDPLPIWPAAALLAVMALPLPLFLAAVAAAQGQARTAFAIVAVLANLAMIASPYATICLVGYVLAFAWNRWTLRASRRPNASQNAAASTNAPSGFPQ